MKKILIILIAGYAIHYSYMELMKIGKESNSDYSVAHLANLFGNTPDYKKGNHGSFPNLRSSQWIKERPNYGKTKYIVCEFFSTWGNKGKENISHLNKLNRKYKDRGLLVVGIAKDSKSTLINFTKKHPINYPIATNGRLISKMIIKSFPYAYIIEEETDIIVWKGNASKITDSIINKLLDN